MIDLFTTYILDPFTYPFMQRALMVSLCVGLVCSLFSCFVVLRGWALMGDAVAHAVLPGLAIAYVIGIPLAIGAFAGGLLCAVGAGYLSAKSRVKDDAILAIVFSGLFAFGLVMLTKIETEIHLLHILFGNILGVSQYDLIETAVISLACSALIFAKRKDLLLYSFDQNHASAIGLSVSLLHFGFLVLLVMTIVSALKAAGIILVIAMLIAPGAIGYLLSRSFGPMMVIAVMVSLASCVAGTIISYHLDAATAPLIVVVQAVIFCIVFAFLSIKNLIFERKKTLEATEGQYKTGDIYAG